MAHLVMGLLGVLAIVAALASADIMEATGGNTEAVDANMMKAYEAIDANVIPKLDETRERLIKAHGNDPDTNKAVELYFDGIIKAAKGNLAVGTSIGKRYSETITFWALPIVILFGLFLMGFPTFTLIGCGILLAWDKAKSKKYSKPKIKQELLK